MRAGPHPRALTRFARRPLALPPPRMHHHEEAARYFCRRNKKGSDALLPASALAHLRTRALDLSPMALLVLLPAATRARVVPSDLRFLALHLLDNVVAAGPGRARRFVSRVRRSRGDGAER